jgi:hypothetical protein
MVVTPDVLDVVDVDTISGSDGGGGPEFTVSQ